MKFCFLLLCLACLTPENARCQTPVTKIFIVRHTDRMEDLDQLSSAGEARAEELKRILGTARIDSIYSTDFLRTRMTARPLARFLKRPVEIYTDIPKLIRHVTGNLGGKRVLITAHSNTIDDLMLQCGCMPPPDIDPGMSETRYDNLFLLLVQKAPGGERLSCEYIHMKYGAETE